MKNKIPLLNKNWLKNLQKNKYLQLLPDFKKEKTQKFITLILTLVTLGFFGIFAIGPTFSTISKLNKELEENRLVDAQLKQKINNLSILQEKYASLQGVLPDIYSAVPKNPEVALFMGQFEKIAKDNNVSVVSAQTLPVEVISKSNVSKRYATFDFSLSVEGDYKNINSFAEAITKMQRIISLDTLSLSNVYDKQKGNVLRLSVKGTAYFKN